MAQLALNTRSNSTIGGLSPFFLRNGYNLDPLGESIKASKKFQHPGVNAGRKFIQRLRDAQDFAQAAMASAQ